MPYISTPIAISLLDILKRGTIIKNYFILFGSAKPKDIEHPKEDAPILRAYNAYIDRYGEDTDVNAAIQIELYSAAE